jgi:hypothetical protein
MPKIEQFVPVRCEEQAIAWRSPKLLFLPYAVGIGLDVGGFKADDAARDKASRVIKPTQLLPERLLFRARLCSLPLSTVFHESAVRPGCRNGGRSSIDRRRSDGRLRRRWRSDGEPRSTVGRPRLRGNSRLRRRLRSDGSRRSDGRLRSNVDGRRLRGNGTKWCVRAIC